MEVVVQVVPKIVRDRLSVVTENLISDSGKFCAQLRIPEKTDP